MKATVGKRMISTQDLIVRLSLSSLAFALVLTMTSFIEDQEKTDEWEYITLKRLINSEEYHDLNPTHFSCALTQTPKKRLICNTLILIRGEEEVGKIRFRNKVRYVTGKRSISELENNLHWRLKDVVLTTHY